MQTYTMTLLDWNQISNNMIDKHIQSYQLLEELGRGSYGCLFLGQSLIDNQYVAIKVLSKTGLDTRQLQLQQLEMDIQKPLNHPHVLGLKDVIQEQDFIYMIMELCDGGDLFEYVIQHPHKEDELVKTLFLQILEGIEYLHTEGIYHRDIKLENILLSEKNVCKVADFGLATKERFSLEFGCGSTTYLGPEHFANEEEQEEQDVPYDAAASDIWSLGILLLALLFNKNPWYEATTEDVTFAEYKQNPSSLCTLFPRLSHACAQFLIDHVLCIDPRQRCDIQTLKQAWMSLTNLTVMPVDIINTKASYDSAYFSHETGLSWSDMVEQDLAEDEEDDEDDDFEHLTEDEELFIHVQEKESWWL
ncbi:kinase-like domain-containing protein [Gilbertella persicaria]|uniref:kinase-like domain-containing protein n=1 Tax=Gilbertella persicaria TaxID=101096 RepID=UPI00221EA91B|nr:kinase-like domain-containing protein [Gilbertella persicaria]KAI8069124.1 kinase-like domain-containing protein [Gilbertella persicaria]